MFRAKGYSIKERKANSGKEIIINKPGAIKVEQVLAENGNFTRLRSLYFPQGKSHAKRVVQLLESRASAEINKETKTAIIKFRLNPLKEASRLLRASELLAELFPEIYGVYYTTKNKGFILMEYKKGIVLSKLNFKRMQRKQKTHLLYYIGRAIALMHKKGILHNDLLLKNIIIKHEIDKGKFVFKISFIDLEKTNFTRNMTKEKTAQDILSFLGSALRHGFMSNLEDFVVFYSGLFSASAPSEKEILNFAFFLRKQTERFRNKKDIYLHTKKYLTKIIRLLSPRNNQTFS